MTLDDVALRIGKSKRTIMRWVDEGRFPAPTTRNGRLILWSDDTIERWSQRGRRRKDDEHAKDRRTPRPARNRVGSLAVKTARKKARQ